MSGTTKSVDDALYQKITDICFENGSVTKPMVDHLYALFTKQLEEAEIRSRLEEVTYWHKRTIREAPYPSQIARTLHEQEDRIATLTQDTKGATQ